MLPRAPTLRLVLCLPFAVSPACEAFDDLEGVLAATGGATAGLGTPSPPATPDGTSTKPKSASATPTDAADPKAGSSDVQLDTSRLRPRPSGSGYAYTAPSGHFQAEIHEDGTVSFTDLDAPRTKGNPLDQGLRFSGPLDWHKKATGATLHRAEKARFLAQTAELRHKLAKTSFEAAVETRRKGELAALRALWNDTKVPARSRRAALFARWDDCEEESPADTQPDASDPSGEGVDALRRRAGAATRAVIVTFIRENLSAGSPDAYPDDELRKLNDQRKSRQPFAPYAAATPVPRPSAAPKAPSAPPPSPAPTPAPARAPAPAPAPTPAPTPAPAPAPAPK